MTLGAAARAWWGQFYGQGVLSKGLFLWSVLLAMGTLAAVADEKIPRGMYRNPIGGDIRMGDPFLVWHEGHYYLYGTTAAGEGFKCWRSSDLQAWEALGFAYRKTDTSWGGKTFWAPEVFSYRDKFYLVYSCQPSDTTSFSTRICLAVSDHPAGPFRDYQAPLFDNGWSCIDGHVFVDEGGKPYLFFDKVGSKKDVSSGKRYLYGMIYVAPLSEDLTKLTEDPVLCTQADQAWEHPQSPRSRCNEGAYVFRVGDTYYLTYSANHYADPFYGIGYATAASPLGPWKKSSYNPLVAQDPARGISGPGHNAVLRLPGLTEWWMVYHTHADPDRPSGNRVVNLDRLRVRDDGTLELMGPTRDPQPVPQVD